METPLLARYQSLLSSIRSLANEKPQIREDALISTPKELEAFLKDLSPLEPITNDLIIGLEEFLLLMLESNRWEDKTAGLYTIQLGLNQGFFIVLSMKSLDKLLGLLTEKEARVRNQISGVLGALALKQGFLEVFSRVYSVISQAILEEIIKEKGRYLESYLLSLVSVLKAWKEGEELGLESLDSIKLLIRKLINHPLKHIRVLGYQALERLLIAQSPKDFLLIIKDFLPDLELGLSDNMTEARFQGTKTAGSALLRLKSLKGDLSGFGEVNDSEMEPFHRLLPGLCFNRLYPAESFSKESLRLWKELVDMHGKKILGCLISESIEYYLKESLKTNAEIRETSCKGFQELMTKAILGNEEAKAKLLLKEGEILNTLLRCTKDPFHLVREAAFTAILAVLIEDNGIFTKDREVILEESLKMVGDSFHESRRTVGEILGVLSEQDIKGDIAFKIINVLQQRISDCKGKEHCLCKEEEENKGKINKENSPLSQHKSHEHEGDIFDCLVGFFKELARVFGKTRPEVVEKALGVMIEKQGAFQKETSQYIRENVWKNLGEGLLSAGKPFLKKNLNEALGFIFEALEGNKGPLTIGVKELIMKLQGFIGPNIMKGRVEGLNGGKWLKLYSELTH